jgi:hypothetical protein
MSVIAQDTADMVGELAPVHLEIMRENSGRGKFARPAGAESRRAPG